LLLLSGAAAKSSQLGLHSWLPGLNLYLQIG
jgi:NADH:ubiquinone oxidoreductase subunit 5 (subunit L)/multisubunit Na+/H+ antiporter MnhA subunit